MTNSLPPCGLQHSRLPYLPPTPGACSNSCPLSWWCHPTISSPVVPFSSCLQSFPASGSFPMSQFFASGGQSIGVLVAISLAYRLCVSSQETEGRFLWAPGAHLSHSAPAVAWGWEDVTGWVERGAILLFISQKETRLPLHAPSVGGDILAFSQHH